MGRDTAFASPVSNKSCVSAFAKRRQGDDGDDTCDLIHLIHVDAHKVARIFLEHLRRGQKNRKPCSWTEQLTWLSSAKKGAIFLQGLHHEAVKSTTSGVPSASDSCQHTSSVSATEEQLWQVMVRGYQHA